MKAAGKLKGLDFKKFFVDHGEKVGLGIVALISIFALVSTRWAGFDEIEPRELMEKVDETRSKVVSTPWPDTEKEQFSTIVNFEDNAESLFAAVDISEYTYSTDMIWPLYQSVEKISEPKWLPPQNLIADSGRVVLAMRLDAEEPSEEGATDGGFGGFGESTAEDPQEVDNEFAPRRTGPGTAPGGAGVAGGMDETTEMGYGQYGGEVDAYNAAFGDEAEGMENPDDLYGEGYGMDLEGEMGEGGLAASTAPTEKAQGYRYVALRSVFPIKDQAAEIRKALSESNTVPISQLVTILNFELQRKRAISGPDPWAGPWEDVDMSLAADILNQASGQEIEVVEVGVTDAAITMPLPTRMMGMWEDHATHPDIKNFELSQEEQEQQEKLIRKYLEKRSKMQVNRPEPVRKGGFAGVSIDFNAVRQDVMGAADANEFLRNTQKDLFGNEKTSTDQAKQIREQLKNTGATGSLVMFRYLDFDVEPGNAYQYRVRLVLKNPNYSKALSDLVDPYSAKGQTRETPWTSLGEPVVVEQDAEYFLTRVNPRTSAASMGMYEWLADTGTLVKGAVDVSLGQFVGGKTHTEVLRPAEGTFEDEEIVLSSNDVLVDTMLVPELDSNMHPDLALNRRSRAETPMVDTSLIMDSNGRLVTVDPLTSTARVRRVQDKLDRMAKAYEFLKDAGGTEDAEGTAGLLEGVEGAGGEGMMDGMGEGLGRSKLRSSRRFRSGGRSGRSTRGAAGAGGGEF